MDVTKVGIVGLGRWAKVLTRAASKSQTLRIVSAYSRSQEKRDAFAHEFGVRGSARSRPDARRSRDRGGHPDRSQ
jgi:predicted dehydrogenase